MTGTIDPFFANHPAALAEKQQQREFMAKLQADAAGPQNELAHKALEMRTAIDMIEGALMGFGDFVDLPATFEGARNELKLTPTVTLGQVRRVCDALAECTRIINSEEYSSAQFSGGTCSGGEG